MFIRNDAEDSFYEDRNLVRTFHKYVPPGSVNYIDEGPGLFLVQRL